MPFSLNMNFLAQEGQLGTRFFEAEDESTPIIRRMNSSDMNGTSLESQVTLTDEFQEL